MSIGHEIEETIHALPGGWTQAKFYVRLERVPAMNAGSQEMRTAAVAKLASHGGRATEDSVEFVVTPATWVSAAQDARAVERSGVRGQVELRDVISANPGDLSRWPSRNTLRGQIVAVPGGYAIREAT
jgi:hypothetical protein